MALEALSSGAVDVVAKPDSRDRNALTTMIADLSDCIKEAALADMRKIVHSNLIHKNHAIAKKPDASSAPSGQTRESNRIIAIGASTGGTNVLDMIIPKLPADCPGVVIVQHMPPVFTRMFADSLNKESRIDVREACDGDSVRTGLALVAPGGLQLTVHKNQSGWIVHCKPGEKISGHCPSVDVLFNSVADAAGDRATGLILTGMGRDGADGLLAMRKAGARCFAQDEESSVVFGMPKEAWENGAAERLIPAEQAAATLVAANTIKRMERSV